MRVHVDDGVFGLGNFCYRNFVDGAWTKVFQQDGFRIRGRWLRRSCFFSFGGKRRRWDCDCKSREVGGFQEGTAVHGISVSMRVEQECLNLTAEEGKQQVRTICAEGNRGLARRWYAAQRLDSPRGREATRRRLLVHR